MNDETRIDVTSAEPLAGGVGDHELGPGEELETPRSRRRIILIAVAAGLAVLAWLLLRPEPAPPAASAASQAPTVTVVAPGRTAVEGTLTATGTLDARRDMPVGSVGEGGQVVRVFVDAGDWVSEGQVLALVDRSVQTQQAASQSAQIQVAQADADLAQANLDRALKLVSRGFISKADVDRLTATRDAANARVRVARAQLGEIQARANRLSILAPAAGLVLERNVEPGQVVGGSSGVLFRVARGGEMEMMAQVSEDDLTKLSVGQSATVTPVGTETGFVGQIWQLSPTIDPETRLGSARVALAYKAGIRPGGFATATIRSGTIVAPMLPESAILSDSRGAFVYVVGRDNKVVRQAVKTGLVTENGIAVVEGLSGNERVVLRAGGFLSAGDRVNPRAGKI
jgi:HlyD family secretion protein